MRVWERKWGEHILRMPFFVTWIETRSIPFSLHFRRWTHCSPCNALAPTYTGLHFHSHASPPAKRHLGSVTFRAEISLIAVWAFWISPPFIRRTAGWTSIVTSENLACLALQMSPIYLCVLFFGWQDEKSGEMTWPYQIAECWISSANKLC